MNQYRPRDEQRESNQINSNHSQGDACSRPQPACTIIRFKMRSTFGSRMLICTYARGRAEPASGWTGRFALCGGQMQPDADV